MLDRSPKIVCVKSELLTPSKKQAMGQNLEKIRNSVNYQFSADLFPRVISPEPNIA